MNLAVTKITGKPVYPILTWEGWLGFFVPVGTILLTLCIYLCIEYCSKRRLRKNGYHKVVDIMEGHRFKQTRIKDSALLKQEAIASGF